MILQSVQDRILSLSPSLQIQARAIDNLYWWLYGGIPAANCIAAYQPKGSTDLAASYINLANPGTYNATPGVAPDFDTTNGWKGTGTQWLRTGIIPTGFVSWSIGIRYSNASENGIISGFTDGGGNYGLTTFIYNALGNNFYRNAGSYTGAGQAGGVIFISGKEAYYAGLKLGDISVGTAPVAREIYLLCCRDSVGGALQIKKAYIQATCIYNISLSAPQVLAVTNAMNAL